MLFKKEAAYVSLSFSKFLETAKEIGYFLIQQGVKKQEAVGLFLENQPNWGCIYFGILFSGAVCVPLDANLATDELENIFNDASVRVVFTSKTLVDKIDTSRRDLKIILVDGPKEPSFLKDINVPTGFAWPESKVEDLCSLVYTSGTTSQPKGVMLTHHNFSANINSIQQLGLFTDKDNFISMLPLHHSYPFMVNLLIPLFLGARITYVESLASEDILRCIKEANITVVSAVPQFFNLLLAGIKTKLKAVPILLRIFLMPISQFLWLTRKFTHLNLAKLLFKKVHSNFGSSLRFFASGGAKLDPKDAIGFMKLGFTILEGYGLTETSPVVSFNMPDSIKIGSIGRSVPDVEVKINNPDKDGIGEILIKGENVFKGYYRREDLTHDAIKDDWFFSGDLGYIDKKGFIYITGRCKEVIVLRSGKNIYPDELESLFRQSRFIKEVCVLEAYDKEKRQVGLHALVVPDMERLIKTRFSDIQGTISVELENLSRRLPSFKHLMGFIIVTQDLPRTRLGKIQRYKAKEIYESKLAVQEKRKKQKMSDFDIQSLPKSGILYKVLTFLSKELKIQVAPDDHLELDLGIDSLKRVELGLSLEKLLGAELPEDLLADVFTVRELVSKLEDIVKEKPLSVDVVGNTYAWRELLSHPPSCEVLEKIKLESGFLNKVITFVVAKEFYLFFLGFCFLRVRGKSNIPSKGPYILCANHTSYFDPFIIASSLPFKVRLQFFFLGHTEIFELPILKWTITTGRIIPIDAVIHLVDAMQASAFILRNSKIACIFPEGQRSMSGGLVEFKNGVGILIKELGVPCIPVYIKGGYQVWPRHKILPRPYPMKITFGKSYTAEELKTKGQKAVVSSAGDYTLITQGIKEAMIELKNKN